MVLNLLLVKTLVKRMTIPQRVWAVVIVLLIISAAWGWLRKPKPEIINTPYPVFTQAPPVPAVVKVETKYVVVKEGKVQVLNKAQVIKLVKDLPDNVTEDSSKQFTSSASIPPHKGKTSVFNVIDMDDGVSMIISKPEPLKFFEIKRERAIGLGYTSANTGMVIGKWGFLRVGGIDFSARGELEFELGNDARIKEGKAIVQGLYEF